MRQRELKHHKGLICVLVIAGAVMLFMSIQQVYVRIFAPEEPIAYVPVSSPYVGSSDGAVQVSPVRRVSVSVPMQRVVTGSTLFSSQSAQSGGKGLYTTSSAQVHSIGGGGASGGGQLSAGGQSAQRGITYQSSSVNLPRLAMVSTANRTAAETADRLPNSVHFRRIQANGDGSYDGETKIEGGKTYYWDEASETWVLSMPIGTTKTEGGITYVWNGSAWEVVTGTDPSAPVPMGSVPWCLLAILVAGYARIISRRCISTR